MFRENDNVGNAKFNSSSQDTSPPQQSLSTVHDAFRQLVSPKVYQALCIPSLAHNICAIVQGIPIPLSTPLYWLALHASHPDLFLYITFVKSPH